MKWLRLCAVLLALVPAASGAVERIKVTSGEHENFTRLVFKAPPDFEWALDVLGNAAELTFYEKGLEFQDSDIFNKIPKTRLLSVSSSPGDESSKYFLKLNCDCAVSAAPYLKNYVVVDISDGPEVKNTVIHPTAVSWSTPLAPKFFDEGPKTGEYPLHQSQRATGLYPAQMKDVAPTVMYTSLEKRGQTPLEPQSIDSDAQTAVDEARNSLLKQLTFAVDQGLLDLSGSTPEISQGAEKEVLQQEEVQAEKPNVNSLRDSEQVDVQNVYDRDLDGRRRDRLVAANGCPREQKLDLPSWGSGEDFFDEVSAIRARMLREFDVPKLEEVAKLVRSYLRYGFGAEARGYLAEHTEIQDKDILVDISFVVEGRSAPIDGPLLSAFGCEGVAGLWAMAAAPPDHNLIVTDADSIITVFASMPIDVRQLVGARLAKAFLERNMPKYGQQVLDIISRAPTETGREHQLVSGKLIQKDGDSAGAISVFQELTAENDDIASDALIDLAQSHLQQNLPTSASLLTDISAAAGLNRGTTRGVTLKQLQARLTARAHGGLPAFELLAGMELEGSKQYQETAEEILAELSSSDAPHEGFPEAVNYFQLNFRLETIPDDLRSRIAEKLLALGLPDFALEVITPNLDGRNIEPRLIAARAELAAYRPENALEFLGEVNGNVARLLRVEAYLKTNQYQEALHQLESFENNKITTIEPGWLSDGNSEIVRLLSEYLPESRSDSGWPEGNAMSTEGADITLLAARSVLSDSLVLSSELQDWLSK